MAEDGEIKLIIGSFSSAQSDLDTRRETISVEKNVYDAGTKLIYQNWKGQAMNACISITDVLNTNYESLIADAKTLSQNMEKTLEVHENTENTLASSYQLGTGGEN